MASEAVEDDDAWLYGDNSVEDQRKEEINAIFDRATEDISVPVEESTVIANGEVQAPEAPKENGEAEADIVGEEKQTENDEKESDEDEDSDDDDDVQVTIGDIKPASTTYPYGGAPVNLNIKRGSTFTSGTGVGSVSKSKGLDIETVGVINDVSIYEFNLDTIEDKPWRKPGADITDYFNYGFSEDSWKAYCEKQRKLRMDNHQILPKTAQLVPGAKDQQIPTATVNENSKYSGMGMVAKKAGPPPGRRMSGSIDVICGTNTAGARRAGNSKENVIQVIGQAGYDSSLPPGMPPTHIPPPFIPPNLSVPPPGLPPGIPPPNIPPPPGTIPGHVPFPDLYGNPIFSQPPPLVQGVVDAAPQYDEQFFTGSQSSRQFDGNSESQHSWNNSPRDRERDIDRNRDRMRDRSRDKRDPEYWDREASSRDRPARIVVGEDDYDYKRRDREEYDRRRYRDYRDRREKDRYERDYEREHYERDREKDTRDSRERERERRHREHKEREDRHKERSSRRRHHHDEEEEYHSTTRHKHKKSKREKEDSVTPAAEASEEVVTVEIEEEEK